MDEIRIQGTQPGTEAQVLGGQVMPPEDVITREQLQEFPACCTSTRWARQAPSGA